MKHFHLYALLLLLLAAAVCVHADEPRLVLNTGGHTAPIRDVIFTRDGKYLISGGHDKVIRVWEVGTGRLTRTIQGEIGENREGEIYAMALSPDERYLAVGGFLAGEEADHYAIRLHNFASGTVVGNLKGHKNKVLDLAFSPDGRYLVSGSEDKTAILWDFSSSPIQRKHVLNRKIAIDWVQFSPDSTRLLTGRGITLWDVSRGELIADKIDDYRIFRKAAVFSPDGHYIVSNSLTTLLLFDAQTLKFIRESRKIEGSHEGIAFSPDGKHLVTGGNGLNFSTIAFPSGKIEKRLPFNFKKMLDPRLADKNFSALWSDTEDRQLATYSPIGTMAALTGQNDGLIYLFDPQKGQVVRTLGMEWKPVVSVGFAHDSQAIAFGNTYSDKRNDNYRGRLSFKITLQTEKGVSIALNGAVSDETAFSRAITQTNNYSISTVKLADYLQVKHGEKLERTISRGIWLMDAPICYSLTPDGKQIVSGWGDGIVTIYETKTGFKLHDLIGHTNTVWAVAASPDNRTLVSGSDDQTIRLWDLASGQNLLSIFVAQDNEWVAWTPQGYYTASLNGDRYIGWHVNHGVDQAADFYPASQFKETYYRPDVVHEYLRTRGDLALALKTANEKRGASFAANPTSAASILTLLPPVVVITAPESEESATNSEMLTVKAVAKRASAEAAPPSDLKLLLNGALVAALKGSQFEMQVRLQPGANTLAVIASNGKAESLPELRKINYTGKGSALDKPNLILLAVGISNYQQAGSSLSFAHKDAAAVAERFKAQTGALFNRVETKVLTNQQATRTEIIRGLSWLKQQAKQGDVIVLYLSGHGGLDGKQNYYFYAHEHDSREEPELFDVKWSVLMDGLTAVNGAKPFLFIDSCRAAAASGGKFKSDGGLTQALKELQTTYRGVVFFAASSNDEPAVELPDKGYSAFTWALLEGLTGKADVTNRDGFIYVDELGSWLVQSVKELTGGKQHAAFELPPGFRTFPLFVVPR